MVDPIRGNKPTTQTESSYNSLTLLTLAAGTAALATGIYGAYRGGLPLKFLNHRNSCISLAATGLTANVAAVALGFAKSQKSEPDHADVTPPSRVEDVQEAPKAVAPVPCTLPLKQLEVAFAPDAFEVIAEEGSDYLYHVKVQGRTESLVLSIDGTVYFSNKATFNRVSESRTEVKLGELHLFDYKGWEMTKPKDSSGLTTLIADPNAHGMEKIATINVNGVRFVSEDLAKEWQKPGTYAFNGKDHISFKSTSNEFMCLPFTKKEQKGAFWEQNGVQYYSPLNGESVQIHLAPSGIDHLFELARQ